MVSSFSFRFDPATGGFASSSFLTMFSFSSSFVTLAPLALFPGAFSAPGVRLDAVPFSDFLAGEDEMLTFLVPPFGMTERPADLFLCSLGPPPPPPPLRWCCGLTKAMLVPIFESFLDTSSRFRLLESTEEAEQVLSARLWLDWLDPLEEIKDT